MFNLFDSLFAMLGCEFAYKDRHNMPQSCIIAEVFTLIYIKDGFVMEKQSSSFVSTTNQRIVD